MNHICIKFWGEERLLQCTLSVLWELWKVYIPYYLWAVYTKDLFGYGGLTGIDDSFSTDIQKKFLWDALPVRCVAGVFCHAGPENFPQKAGSS